ncbi:MAG: ABC transporter ATP-binding protein [Clostridia bacterium]|nr:ABC transporter ATP-binding protein [Clostridia bacterium]
MKRSSTLKQVFHYLKKYKLYMLLSILFAAVTVIFSLYIPIVIGDTIDLIIGKDSVDFKSIGRLLTTVAIIAVGVAVFQWIMNNINNKIVYNITKDVRNEAFEKIHSLPLKYIDSHSYGEVVSKVITDVDQFADGLLMGFTQLFTGIVTIIATLVFMLTISWQITIVVVVLTPLSLFVANFIAKRTYSMFSAQSKTRADQTAIVEEMIGNQKTVKAFSHEDEAIEKFDIVNDKLEKCSIKAIFFSSLVNPCTRFINSLIYASVALVGAFMAMGSFGSVLTIGALSCFLSYATQYAKPFNEISGVISELQNSFACASRTFEFINEDSEVADSSANVLDNVNGRIDFENVSFSYNEDQKLIENLSFSASHGQRVAIVGPTGCGKTTLINLIMRFYDVKSGSISVDGSNIKEITRHSLRKSFGMVLQDTWVRNASIYENIAIGKPNATYDEIINAAKLSHAHSFIKRLPNGYDTVVSESSSILSQGQKQLLCIARVMLALPPMLILDEATSSIDTRTELKIQEAFSLLMENRTSFIVAHRLSTIKEADIILVMKNGNIVEKGNHDELIKKQGFYYKLYNSQFGVMEESL